MENRLTITRGKFDGITAIANEDGVISAAAMDQRGSLQKSIGKARGDGGVATGEDLAEFKRVITKVLTPHASAILMDPEYGLEALEEKAPGTGVLLAYEKTGYDATVAGRLPDLLDEWSVRRLKEAGADAVKILLYYNPDDTDEINTVKHAFIERIGSECTANDIAFFLEPITYADGISGADWAQQKPDRCRQVDGGVLQRSLRRRCSQGRSSDRYEIRVGNRRPLEAKRSTPAKKHSSFSGTLRPPPPSRSSISRLASAIPYSRKPSCCWRIGCSLFRCALRTGDLAGWCADLWRRRLGCARSVAFHGRGRATSNELTPLWRKGAKPWWTIYGGIDQITVVDPTIA